MSDSAKIIAVWGSPGSGKTTFATKLARAIYDSYQATVAVLYTDLQTPVLPVIFPNEKPEDLGSIGVPLSKTEPDAEDILRSAVTLKKQGNLVFFGYRAGDNPYTYAHCCQADRCPPCQWRDSGNAFGGKDRILHDGGYGGCQYSSAVCSQ